MLQVFVICFFFFKISLFQKVHSGIPSESNSLDQEQVQSFLYMHQT